MIKVGNETEIKKRLNWWYDRHVCYTGYGSKPFKVDDNNYQIKCICNSSGLTVNKFKEVYINFNLKELHITEETFLSHFVMPGYITEFYIYYDRALKTKNLIYAYYYEENKKFKPDKYGRFYTVFNKLDNFKTQTKAKIDVPNPYYWND